MLVAIQSLGDIGQHMSVHILTSLCPSKATPRLQLCWKSAQLADSNAVQVWTDSWQLICHAVGFWKINNWNNWLRKHQGQMVKNRGQLSSNGGLELALLGFPKLVDTSLQISLWRHFFVIWENWDTRLGTRWIGLVAGIRGVFNKWVAETDQRPAHSWNAGKPFESLVWSDNLICNSTQQHLCNLCNYEEMLIISRVFRFTSKSEFRLYAWGAHVCIELTSSGHFWSFDKDLWHMINDIIWHLILWWLTIWLTFVKDL